MVKSSRLCGISGTGCFRAEVAHELHRILSGNSAMQRLFVGTLIAVSTILAPAAIAAPKIKATSSSPLITAIDRCRQIADPTQRLACYDSAASALVTATTSGSVSIVDRNEVRQVRHSLFGFSLPKIPFFSGDTTANEAQEKLDSTITKVRYLNNGHYEIVIADNNAVWETTESGGISWEPPHVGQKIEILRGALGNYFLRIDGQLGVRGKRVG
jgi:hypothetical protein